MPRAVVSPENNNLSFRSFNDSKTHTAARHFDIVTMSHSSARVDIIAIPKGRNCETAAVVFKEVYLKEAQVLTEIFQTAAPVEGAARDPVPSMTLMIEALAVAEFYKVSHATLTGGRGYEMLSTFFDAQVDDRTVSEIREMCRTHSLGGGIYFISFPNQCLMAKTFLRPQEFFESPRFRGEVFSLDEYKSWYRSVHEHGEFSYYFDWAGFNLPSCVLKPFLDGSFGALSTCEEALFAPLRAVRGPFYVIATSAAEGSSTLRHEIAHALYFTNEHYRNAADAIVASIDRAPLERFLKRLGYHSARWADEMHAYLGDPLAEIEGFDIKTKGYEKAHRALLRLYAKYAPPQPVLHRFMSLSDRDPAIS